MIPVPLTPNWFVVLMTQLSDALQFLYGKAMGRRRWTPISPNKTVEGSLLAGVTIVILTFLQASVAMPEVPPQGVLIAGLIIAIGGQIGDLTMANVKRNAGVKDFGTVLPGHGVHIVSKHDRGWNTTIATAATPLRFRALFTECLDCPGIMDDFLVAD